MNGVKKFTLKHGLNLYYLPLEKFKTSTISVNIHRELSREDATWNALLPYVLRRGCTPLPTAQAIAEYLESLYGTIFDCGINKKGEDQIIYFNFETIGDQYIPGDIDILEKVIKFAADVIFDPVTENGVFKKEFVVQEKEKLKDLIEGLVNNKMTYAIERCYQEMCKDEKYGIYELGKAEDLHEIDEKNLYEHYRRMISTSPIDIFVAGNMEEENIKQLVGKYFNITLSESMVYPHTTIVKEVSGTKKVEEEMEVAQGKLSLGFRTKISPRDSAYYPLMVYNGILGGGPHSKLFNNVREKLSLAYYVFSRLEKFKGLMMISSGIEVGNYQKALDEILVQMDAIKRGDISDTEYQATISSLVNGIKSLQDNAYHMIDYYIGQLLSGTDVDFHELIDQISAVKKQDVVAVAQDIELDTIYFLKNKQ